MAPRATGGAWKREVAGARGCSKAEYCTGAGSRQSTVRGRKSVWWWGPQHPSVGGAELQGRNPRKCTVREQGPQQSTVRERRSVWRGPQHPSVGGGGWATGARPAEVYCKGAGVPAEYCTEAEECVVGSTTPVRRGGRSYRGEARGIRPWVETQVCKVTINYGSLRQRSRQPFAEI